MFTPVIVSSALFFLHDINPRTYWFKHFQYFLLLTFVCFSIFLLCHSTYAVQIWTFLWCCHTVWCDTFYTPLEKNDARGIFEELIIFSFHWSEVLGHKNCRKQQRVYDRASRLSIRHSRGHILISQYILCNTAEGAWPCLKTFYMYSRKMNKLQHFINNIEADVRWYLNITCICLVRKRACDHASTLSVHYIRGRSIP